MPGCNNSTFKPVKPRAYGSGKEVAARAVQQCGGAEEACVILDRSKSTVYGYTDPVETTAHLAYEQARRLTKLGGGKVTALAEDLAQLAGGVFVPLHAPDGMSTWADIGALASAEGSQFLQVLIRALSDDRLDAAERARLKRETHDVLRVFAGALAKLEEGEG
jgi:hypothetical protein